MQITSLFIGKKWCIYIFIQKLTLLERKCKFYYVNIILSISFFLLSMKLCNFYFIQITHWVLHFSLQWSQFVLSYKYSNGIFDDQKARARGSFSRKIV